MNLTQLYQQLIVVLTKLRDTILSKETSVNAVVMTPKQNFFAFIRNYEGANPANNNPYDDKYFFGGYLPKYGTVKESSGGFAIFETLALGEMYGETIITQMILKHPGWDFYDFFSVYAPSKDNNNPMKYAKAGAAWMKVEPTANLKSILNL